MTQQISDEINPNDNRLILADKPLDWTSAGVLNVLKKVLNVKKAGHAGTLDPRATGLLIICTGKMTKAINTFIEYDKEYEGIIRIGAVTESYDTESEEENIRDISAITDEMLNETRDKFLGETEQIPPMHSAIKHKGKPLYKMARKGKEVERQPRRINIKEFEIKRLSDTEVFFRILCIKGTYIRSIANDFGRELGVGGYLKTLKRTRIGDYKLEDFSNEVREIKYKIL